MTAPGFRNLMRGSAIYAAGNFANRLTAILLLPVFTAHMVPAEFGVLALLTATGALLVPLFSLGLGTSIGVCYFNASDPLERRTIIWSAARLMLGSALVLGCAGWAAREVLSRLFVGDASHGEHAAWAMAAAAAGIMAIPWQLKLQFEERPAAFVFASLLGAGVTIGASLLLVVGYNMGALGALAGAFTGQLAAAVAAFAFAGEAPLPDAGARHLRELVSQGLPMIPSFCFLFVLQQGVRWPLEWLHGLEAVGVYSVGASLGSAIGVLTAAFLSAWMPFALRYADSKEEAAQALGRITLFFVAGFGFVVCLFFLFAVPMVALFGGDAYRGAAAVVGLSAASQFFLALFSVLLPPLYFAKRVGNVVVTQSLAAGVACILSLWLVPAYGVAGAATAVALSTLALVLFQWAALRAMPVLHIAYDYRRIGVLLLLFAAVGGLSFRIRYAEFLVGAAQATGLVLAAGSIALWGFGRLRGTFGRSVDS